MKFFIPDLGTRLVLSKDWTFKLHKENRNKDVLKLSKPMSEAQLQAEIVRLENEANKEEKKSRWAAEYIRQDATDLKNKKGLNIYPKVQDFTIGKGTVLEVDRIYIRKGASDFSSVTFRIKGGKTSPRFWAKLEDVNKIEATIQEKEVEWPNGRFILARGTSRLRTGHTDIRRIGWVSSDKKKVIGLEGGEWKNGGQYVKGVFKYLHTTSLMPLVTTYTTFDKLMEGANRLNYPADLIQEFIKEYTKINPQPVKDIVPFD